MQGYDIKTRTLQSTLKFHINLHCVINLHYNKVIVIKTALDNAMVLLCQDLHCSS